MKTPNIGKMNKRVTFQRIAENKDALGHHQSWEDVKTVWASIAEVRGMEYYDAQKIRSEKTYKIYCRYTSGIEEDMRLVYGEKTLNIVDVNDIDEDHALLEIQAVFKPKKKVTLNV